MSLVFQLSNLISRNYLEILLPDPLSAIYCYCMLLLCVTVSVACYIQLGVFQATKVNAGLCYCC